MPLLGISPTVREGYGSEPGAGSDWIARGFGTDIMSCVSSCALQYGSGRVGYGEVNETCIGFDKVNEAFKKETPVVVF